LAIAGREHTFGTNPNSVLHRCITRSWTNARSVRDPSLTGWEIVTDPVRRSQYVRYASDMDSVRDGLYRVDDPTFAYAGKTSILEIIQTWAPSSDGNAPRAYAEQVARWINEWAAEFPPGREEASTVEPLRVAIAAGHRNRDGGNALEMEIVGPLTKAYVEEFRRVGADVRCITPGDGLGMFPGGLQDVAQRVVDWARSGWVADLFLEVHTEGAGGRRGVFAIYP